MRRDAEGRIVAGPFEEVPFLLTIPADADRGISRRGRAPRLQCIAAPPASRAPTPPRAGVSARDRRLQRTATAPSPARGVNTMRSGAAGRRRLRGGGGPRPSGRVFGVLGTAPGLLGFSVSARDLLQFAADVFSAGAPRARRHAGRAVRRARRQDASFDPGRIGFIGNSLGAVVGASVIVAEPDVRAAVQEHPAGIPSSDARRVAGFRSLVRRSSCTLGLTGPLRREASSAT